MRELIRTTSNTNNKVLKPSHSACYTMGPRVREDDKNKKRKSRAKFSGKEQKTQHTTATPPTVIPAHAGDPFIHTCQKRRLEMYSPRQTITKAKPTEAMKCQNQATALTIRWVPAFARMTKIRKEKAELSSAAKNKKTQHTAATPPTVIPAQAGIYSSTHARSRVWKHIHNNRQKLKRNQQQHRQ
ncbi:hypothetical protein ACSTEF_00020 [Vibrio vulnificus]|uniref:hypothetical protein n=1 Tax=Vibrio vulnificus TaxID=672 RepID=UPI003EDAA712